MCGFLLVGGLWESLLACIGIADWRKKQRTKPRTLESVHSGFFCTSEGSRTHQIHMVREVLSSSRFETTEAALSTALTLKFWL